MEGEASSKIFGFFLFLLRKYKGRSNFEKWEDPPFDETMW